MSKVDFDFTLPRTMELNDLVDTGYSKKDRNFPGAWTSKGKCGKGGPCGPAVIAEKLPLPGSGSGSLITSGGNSGADANNGMGDGGGAMGEAIAKFESFLDSLQTEDNQNLIQAVKKGFNAIK